MLEIISSSTEISALFASGKYLSGSCISLLVGTNTNEHDHSGRVAFVAGKRHGTAVWRNKAKRRMREVARDMGGAPEGLDVVFIAKPTTTTQNYSKVLQQAKQLLQDYLRDK